ncbi:type ISP restriction/modification enzyme [Corynebacterium matruchotii]|uniref:type ISP restriction/modification enzyme n=1 Tax=Corynebacterium matruchotii TaxID=43768 RepID=UPI0028EAD1C3|nr:type ISP restriction/modification enzyme [Corynebacterium matruchotii]
MIISTTDKWSSNAESMLENQLIPTSRIGLSTIAESPIDWDIVYPGSEISFNLTLRETYEPRPHQVTAIDKTLAGFQIHDRGKLIMACGTGKTFTALRLAEQFAEKKGGKARILFLVPSISLLSQTLKEWTAQARMDMRSYAVCSDNKVAKKAEDIATYDLEVPVSTNGEDIYKRLSHGKRAKGLTVVFSTYQSLAAIHDAQQHGFEPFDLIICDEAHRTTGATLLGDEPSVFSRIHDANYIAGTKRLYMTATPRLFDENVKGKAVEHSAELYSMDDEAVYGPEFHRLGFGDAVEMGLLTDYKVLVMTVDESVAADAMARFTGGSGQELTLSLASAMIGAWNGVAKRSGKEQGTSSGFAVDAEPMRRTVAFAKDIKTSKEITETYPALIRNYQSLLLEASAANDISLHHVDLRIAAQHVDGGMNAMQRNTKLSWLQSTMPTDETRILTNARCLSEGVDVPALDAVVFFHPRNSMVDVVQSVGRVMRKSEGKDYGYIILPVAVPPNESPAAVLDDNKRFKVVWQILNALRAHDERFDARVNSLSLNEGDADLPVETDHTGPMVDNAHAEAFSDGSEVTQMVLFSLEEWQEAIYTKLVDKVGSRTYWDKWAEDVARIAQAQITRITAIVEDANPRLRKEFDHFVEGLRGNLNDSITEQDAISMLSQHLITAPVFNALFSEYDFAKQNPVSQVMQRMVDALSDHNVESETESLADFYQSVQRRAEAVNSASGKQQVVKDLYETFFQTAFKKQSEALGIVYTPVEIVDFILRAANDAMRKHFGRTLSDENVHILDPFAGTGTFIVRLLESGLIRPEDTARKYAKELHATEIMLLAYYVAAVNIEMTYNSLRAEAAKRDGKPEPEYVPFNGIALADTFQVHEDDDTLDLKIFKENNERIEQQKTVSLQAIVANPPYSSGQNSANDLNANLKYPTLDAHIENTYAARSVSTNKNSLYDSYLRAFRWATDRIDDQGVIAFITNNGWIDGNTGAGVRLSFVDDFSDIYVYNLRGNSRNSGEQAKREGGNVFNVRVGICVTIAVKDASQSGCQIHYYEVEDYASREEKLQQVSHSTLDTIEWVQITANEYGDWLNHRSPEFGMWPVIGDKGRAEKTRKVFYKYGAGLQTNRDAWVYNSSLDQLHDSVIKIGENYNRAVADFGEIASDFTSGPGEKRVNQFLKKYPQYAIDTEIKWSRSLRASVAKALIFEPDNTQFVQSMYRPFHRQHVYFDRLLNHERSQLPSMFPTSEHRNIGFVVMAPRDAAIFAVLAVDLIPDLSFFTYTGQFFPRFTWEKVDPEDGGLFGAVGVDKREESKYGVIGEEIAGYVRVDNITADIKKLYRDALGADITGDDIFHFVYGKLHDPGYRETYAADLKKMLPHIQTPATREEFNKFAVAGERLMELHVGYENVEPWPLTIDVSADADDRETWRVAKMKWKKRKEPETGKSVDDVTTLIYNRNVVISNIPEEADRYMLGARSAVAWLIDRYQVKKDKASGIVNDPNDWCDEVGNPRYIVDLIGKVVRVAVETVRIVDGL